MKEDQMMKNTMKKIPRRRTRLMKKTFVCSVVLLVSLMALGASGAWAVVDIPLVNPGFELGPSQNDMISWNQWLDPDPGPSKWWIYYGGAGVGSFAGTGKNLRMGWGGATCIVRQFVGSAYPVEANTTYTVSAMVKKAAGAGSGFLKSLAGSAVIRKMKNTPMEMILTMSISSSVRDLAKWVWYCPKNRNNTNQYTKTRRERRNRLAGLFSAKNPNTQRSLHQMKKAAWMDKKSVRTKITFFRYWDIFPVS